MLIRASVNEFIMLPLTGSKITTLTGCSYKP